MMTDLITRLESAPEGSASLDKEIALAVFPNAGNNWIQRPYSQSIDAAITLVPKGWTAWTLRSIGNKQRFVAELSKMVGDQEEYAIGHAPTPALAMCIARMRGLP